METFGNKTNDRGCHWILISNINPKFIFVSVIWRIWRSSDHCSPVKNIILKDQNRELQLIKQIIPHPGHRDELNHLYSTQDLLILFLIFFRPTSLTTHVVFSTNILLSCCVDHLICFCQKFQNGTHRTDDISGKIK
jgi:hypothetical protein